MVKMILGGDDRTQIVRLYPKANLTARFLDVLDLLFGRVDRKQAGRKCFKLGADLIDTGCVLPGDLRDDRSAVRQVLDQSFGLKMPQRFPDRRAADPHQFAQLLLNQALAGLEPARRDGRANGLEHFLPNRSGKSNGSPWTDQS